MLSNLPNYIFVVFLLIFGVTLIFFLKLLLAPLVAKGRKTIAWIITLGFLIWLGFHSFLASQEFYISSYELPPRAFLMIVPSILAIFTVLVFLWKSNYLRQLSLSTMTHIHIFRFPLEFIVFTGFAASGTIPEIMTFYGSNPDILVGITAPIIGYLYFSRKNISKNMLLAWNIISLLLLFNITTIAILSMPYPFQQFGIGQPNIALFSFPFIFLPSFLVGVAYFCHIISIHKILVFKSPP
ncbi:hypothetical protein MNBD_GAMMA16-321 [hydrothermal vent metagenome]|uniref:Uncharacterized protein n=1 Tax=hydrothermal vent metagenome TaxID=652676 RepID=A0A3B0Z4Q7_9ZZZZ